MMSCSSRAIRARSAAVACSAWRSSAALRAASPAACLRARTRTPASQNASSCSNDNVTPQGRHSCEGQRQPAMTADHDHDRGDEDQASGRAAETGVRAQCVGGGEQHEREGCGRSGVQAKLKVQRFGVPAQGEEGLQCKGRPDRCHISSGARRRSTSGAPSSRGSSASSHEGPAIGVLPIRPGGLNTAMAISPAAAIPSPASAMMPGSPPAKRRSACMHPTVSPGQATRISRAATWIQTCGLNRFVPEAADSRAGIRGQWATDTPDWSMGGDR